MKARAYISILVLLMSMVLPSYAKESISEMKECHQEVSFDETFALEDYNFVLGTQGIGGKYQFSNESKLIEQAKHIRGMGSNILKISLGPKSPKSYGFGKSKATSTLELFQSIPDYKQVFDMYFKYIFIN